MKIKRYYATDMRAALIQVRQEQGPDAVILSNRTTADGVDGLLPHVLEDNIQIAFDATSAYVHAENSRKLNELGVLMIDLTPAAIGPFCVPPVNLIEHVGSGEMNVNMVTCGGQATIPMVAAVSRVQPVKYGEIVATVSSKSAGPGTRKNIDEFTRTTAGAVEKVGGAKKGKAIIIINPAEPPLIMRDTVHCLTETEPDQAAATRPALAAQGWTRRKRCARACATGADITQKAQSAVPLWLCRAGCRTWTRAAGSYAASMTFFRFIVMRPLLFAR